RSHAPQWLATRSLAAQPNLPTPRTGLAKSRLPRTFECPKSKNHLKTRHRAHTKIHPSLRQTPDHMVQTPVPPHSLGPIHTLQPTNPRTNPPSTPGQTHNKLTKKKQQKAFLFNNMKTRSALSKIGRASCREREKNPEHDVSVKQQ